MAGLFVSEQGDDLDKPLVVLVHGSMDRSSAFARVQRHLADLHVVRYDRRGYGRSLELGPPPAFDHQVEDLEHVMAGRHGVVVGHSLGGVVALALAQRRPELVRAVVAYESPMAWEPWWSSRSAGGDALAAPSPQDAAEGFMRRMVGQERWERLPSSTRSARRAEGPALLADLRQIRDRSQPPYQPEQVHIPVVAAHGSESSDNHRRTAVVLAERAPRAELVVVEGAGHGVHLTHPGELARLARVALERADLEPGRIRS